MVSCDATLTTLGQPGSSATISWSYVDDSSGLIIDPTTFSAKLFDPNDIQRSPADTSVTTAATFTPTKDTTGSVTGTVGKYYVTVTFATGSTTGVWYVQTTYSWENVSRTKNICFNVVPAGASVQGNAIIGTTTAYIIPKDIESFLMLENVSFDQNGVVPYGRLEKCIIEAEGEFERRSGTAFRPVFVTEEMHDLQAWKGSHRELFNDSWLGTPRPMRLQHRPIIPWDTTRGHKIEMYDGNDNTHDATAPEGSWDDFITTKVHSRNGDYWTDLQGGKLHVRKAFLYRRYKLCRITYEYGKPVSTTTAGIIASDTTVNVISTYGYSGRGIIRVGQEYMFHTGKTPTSFTGCVRGQLNTNATSHASGNEVYEIPDDIRSLITKRASQRFLENESGFMNTVPKGSDGAYSIKDRVEAWGKEFDETVSKSYQRFSLIR